MAFSRRNTLRCLLAGTVAVLVIGAAPATAATAPAGTTGAVPAASALSAGAASDQALVRVIVPDQGTRKVRDEPGFDDAAAAFGDLLSIHDQANLGGSGGFSRAMLESLDEIQDDQLKPVTTSFLAFQSNFSRDWGLTSAAGIIIIIPVVILFLILQRRFISGLTAGGLKG